MNKKRIIAFLAAITILLLGGCGTAPYYAGAASYGATGYYGGARTNVGYRAPFYSNLRFSTGHRHVGSRHFNGGHRGHKRHGLHRGGGS